MERFIERAKNVHAKIAGEDREAAIAALAREFKSVEDDARKEIGLPPRDSAIAGGPLPFVGDPQAAVFGR